MQHRIELMRPDPCVWNGEHARTITGVQKSVFRLLVLHKGHTVSKESIANLRETQPTASNSKIRYLREQLEEIGCHSLIESDRGTGYRAALEGWAIDCVEFERAIAPLTGSFDKLLQHPLSTQEAWRDVKALDKQLDAWRGNPAAGLDEGEGRGLHARFESFKQQAEDRLLMARLYTGDHSEIREAIQGLMVRARRESDLAVWKLLLLAFDAIDRKIDPVVELIEKQFRDPPPVLKGLMIAIRDGKLKDNPFRRDELQEGSDARALVQPATGSADDRGLLQLCSLIGITTTTKLSLTDSHIAPLACIRRTRSRLFFSGVLASKWVEKPDVFSEFKELLNRLDKEQGEVKFLIINPFGEAFRRLHALRGGRISTNSLGPLERLSAEHPCFQVRLIDSLPAFRIVSIDDDVLSFSPYRLAAAAYVASGSGWEAPHIVLDPLADYPLAEAFRLLFSENWEKALPLNEALPR